MSSVLPESYLKVAYDLRPAKQVERRMIVDVLQRLAGAGYSIRDYQYTGMGSFYFVDFILFHKLLGIERMVSVEASERIRRRIYFNRPFRSIELEFGTIGDFIPALSRDRKHLLWLDYDQVLHEEILNDVVAAATQLTRESILLITVDIEPPNEDGGPREWFEYFREELGSFVSFDATVSEFTRSNLWRVNQKVLENGLKAGLAGRDEVEFLPLFAFIYADGHRMLTIGGVIGASAEMRKLAACDLSSATFVRMDLESEPFEIVVPRITRKERLYLDAAMPCDDEWVPDEFELDESMVRSYREIYRYYPSYAELLL